MEEIYKDIPNCEGYKVSNLGNVMSFKKSTHIVLKPSINKGYKQVSLSVDNKQTTKPIHTLVAIAFLNHKPNGMKSVIDHIDNNRLNNSASNLQITTQRINSSKDRECGKSKYLGVVKNGNKWVSRIHINNKRIHLGIFKTELEASLSYQMAVKNHENGKEIIVKKPHYTSKYKGVSYKSAKGFYSAYIRINGKAINLGGFKKEIDAYNFTLIAEDNKKHYNGVGAEFTKYLKNL